MKMLSHPINRTKKLRLAGLCSLLVTASLTFAQTWTQTSAPSLDWLSLACSADGSHLLAGGRSALCTSTNAGVDWTTNNVPVHTWSCVASSADGSQLAAAVGYPDTGRIYLSTLPPAHPLSSGFMDIETPPNRIKKGVNHDGHEYAVRNQAGLLAC